ncbi:hypothetical protein B296_00028093 [Ensete ventricosum]|uniref:NFD4 C-terminal domain-containing protein n=1 Tax=Ensete ventricosum TaxID=4639 RepID=A0A427ANK5_ENSVE|nr:hypothetical protein B296_00028093 [Ensete ventricosum]
MSTAVIGAFTGAITSIAVSATTELFGTKHFSVNHNIVVTNIPAGSFVFGYLAAVLYQRGATGGSNSCRGTACYETTFVLWGATCSVASILCTALYIRRRRSPTGRWMRATPLFQSHRHSVSMRRLPKRCKLDLSYGENDVHGRCSTKRLTRLVQWGTPRMCSWLGFLSRRRTRFPHSPK